MRPFFLISCDPVFQSPLRMWFSFFFQCIAQRASTAVEATHCAFEWRGARQPLVPHAPGILQSVPAPAGSGHQNWHARLARLHAPGGCCYQHPRSLPACQAWTGTGLCLGWAGTSFHLGWAWTGLCVGQVWKGVHGLVYVLADKRLVYMSALQGLVYIHVCCTESGLHVSWA